MTEPSTTLPIDLRLPPDPAMSKVLRLAASGVGSLCGFTIREIEEIKLAVSEVLIALIEHGGAGPTQAAPVAIQVIRDYVRLKADHAAKKVAP